MTREFRRPCRSGAGRPATGSCQLRRMRKISLPLMWKREVKMRRVNFDHLACSLVLPEAREAMLPFLGDDIGNPLSRHSFGDKPRAALEEARVNIARLVNAAL